MLDQNWYYTIEVEPGVFTKGKEHANIALTRKLMSRIDVRNMDCIDIGTQEGVVPILLKKRGARRVVAYDQVSVSDRIEFVQKRHGVHFDYLAGFQIPDLPARLDQLGGRFFDLVVFSGVLYHTINPFGLMTAVRGLCKIGGLFVIETAATQHQEECLFLNARGPKQKAPERLRVQLRPGQQSPTYFLPATAWLEYALRMLALQPLCALYIGSLHPDSRPRVAVLCRSVSNAAPVDSSDSWMQWDQHRQQFEREAQIDWTALAKTKSTIECSPADSSVLDLKNRSLFNALASGPPYPYTNDEVRLLLSAEV